MKTSEMQEPTPDWLRDVRAVASAPASLKFTELVQIAGLDRRKDFVCADLSWISFQNCNLKDYNFAGARLVGCDFTGSWIRNARFDQAEIDFAESGPLIRTFGLDSSADWHDYVNEWALPNARLLDNHFSVGSVFQDAPFAPQMVVVPPGKFIMGTGLDKPPNIKFEGPAHEAIISKPFAVSRFAITQWEWEIFKADGKIYAGATKARGANLPQIDISWHDAKEYIQWLSKKTKRAYHLLSETEWEYIARGGTSTLYWWGDQADSSRANFGRQERKNVHSLGANPFGLFHILGNVAEWVDDDWDDTYFRKPRDGGVLAFNSERRVVRGGSNLDDAEACRCASRKAMHANQKRNDVGLRVARKLTLS